MAKLFYQINGNVDMHEQGQCVDLVDNIPSTEIGEDKILGSISYRVLQSLIAKQIVEFVKYVDEDEDVNICMDANSNL